MKLYEIPAAWRTLEKRIEEAEGLLTPELEAELDGLAEEFDRGVEFIAMLAREASLEEAKWKNEEDRVAAIRRSFGRRAEGLKRYLDRQMTAMGISKVDGEKLSTVLCQNSSPTVMFEGDPMTLPEEFRRVKVEMNAAAIRDAYKAGETLPEGVEIHHGTHVRIR